MATNIQTFSGDIDVTSNLTVNTNTLYVDSVKGRVGMKTTTPNSNLHVVGNVFVTSDITTSSNIFIKGTAAATSKTTGALQVSGGVGIQGDIYATNITATGTVKGATLTGTTITGTLSGSNAASVTTLTATDTTASTSTVTGALTVAGGLGVAANMYASNVVITSGLASTSKTTGALRVTGGVGVSANIYAARVYTDDYLTHSDDTNTYIGFPANDTFTVTTAGTERVRVDSSGRVGIGTTAPQAKMDTRGDAIFDTGKDDTTLTGLLNYSSTQSAIDAGIAQIASTGSITASTDINPPPGVAGDVIAKFVNSHTTEVYTNNFTASPLSITTNDVIYFGAWIYATSDVNIQFYKNGGTTQNVPFIATGNSTWTWYEKTITSTGTTSTPEFRIDNNTPGGTFYFTGFTIRKNPSQTTGLPFTPQYSPSLGRGSVLSTQTLVAREAAIKTLTGNVGIGTDNPDTKLHITAGLLPYDTWFDVLKVNANDDWNIRLAQYHDPGNFIAYALKQKTTSGEAHLMTFKYGSVGIGTTNPRDRFHLYGSPLTQHSDSYSLDTAGWYKIGTFTASEAGARLKIRILGSFQYGAGSSRGGQTEIYGSINNQVGDACNMGGTYNYIGQPAVTSVKFVQTGASEAEYEVRAYFQTVTAHSFSVECNRGVFVRSWTASSDPGNNSATVEAAILTHGISEGGAATFGGSLTTTGVYTDDYLTHNGDTNTYIGFPANDTFTVTTSDAERMRVDSSGNVGIGTNDPSERLHVVTAGNAPVRIESPLNPSISFVNTEGGAGNAKYGMISYKHGNRGDVDQALQFYNTSSSGSNLAFRFITSGVVTRAVILDNGSVGIGTESPGARLEVLGDSAGQWGNIITLKNSAASTRLSLKDEQSSPYIPPGLWTGSGGGLSIGSQFEGIMFYTSVSGATPVERMRITSGGYVGIGKTNPDGLLHVRGSGQTDEYFFNTGSLGGSIVAQSSDSDVGSGGSIVFGTAQGYFAAIKASIQNGGGNSIGRLYFMTRNATTDGTLTTRLSINNNGRIGIGMVDPSEKLDVGGMTLSRWGMTIGNSPYGHTQHKTEVIDFSTGNPNLTMIFQMRKTNNWIPGIIKVYWSKVNATVSGADGGAAVYYCHRYTASGIGAYLASSIGSTTGISIGYSAAGSVYDEIQVTVTNGVERIVVDVEVSDVYGFVA